MSNLAWCRSCGKCGAAREKKLSGHNTRSHAQTRAVPHLPAPEARCYGAIMSGKHPVDASENTTSENRPPGPDPDTWAADLEGFLGPRSASGDQHRDSLFDAVFRDPAYAAALLWVMLPPELIAQLDLSSLEPLPAGVVRDGFEQRQGDRLFRARMVDGTRASVRIHHTAQESFVRVVALQTAKDVEQTPPTLDPSLEPRTYERGYAKGREHGVETGVEKGERALLLRLLVRRFGALPDSVARRVAGARTREIEHWFDRAVDAASCDAVFATP
jgi:Putative transposase, YhgA-like